MSKFLKAILKVGPTILNNHLRHILPFARHPERYPYDVRYERTRQVISKVFKSFRVDHIVEGLDNFLACPGKVVIVSNHYSIADPLNVIAISPRPLNFIAKQESFRYPFVKSYLKALQSISLEREKLASQVRATVEAIRLISDREQPDFLIYGEGTRNKRPGGGILPLHPGTFKIAYKAKASIVPVAIYGTFRILSRKVELSSYPVQIRFFPPITPEEYEKIKTVDLAPKVERMIAEEVQRMKKKDLAYIHALPDRLKKRMAAIQVDLPLKEETS